MLEFYVLTSMEAILQLNPTTSSVDWIYTLSEFVRVFDSLSKTADPPETSVALAIEVVVAKLVDVTSDRENAEIELLLLDTIRILLRFRAPLNEQLTLRLLRELLQLACTADRDFHTKQLAVRCLINVLFDNERSVRLFTADQLDRVRQLAVELQTSAAATLNTELLNFQFYIVRLVYMMLSQSGSILGDTLSPTSEATKQLVQSLIVCLHKCSAGHPASGKGASPMFPPCESAGKLYLEISKLLYALSVHDVLQQYDNITDTGTPTKKAESTSSATTTNTTTTTITCIHSTDSKSYTTLQLKQLLGQSILTALTAADPHTGLTHFPSNTSCTAGTQTEKGAEEKAEKEAKREVGGVATAGSEVDEVSGVLREFREQCEEVALQLAMYAQADMLLLLLELAPSHPEDAGGGTRSKGGKLDAPQQQQEQQSVAVHLTRFVLRILERLLGRAGALKRAGEQAALLTPALVVLTNLCAYSPACKVAAKSHIFPTPYVLAVVAADDDDVSCPGGNIKSIDLDHPLGGAGAAGAGAAGAGAGVGFGATDNSNTIFKRSTDSNLNNNIKVPASNKAHSKMDPTDAPADTVRGKMIKYMTSLDSQLKRCVAELIFLLCDEDPDEFTARTGFGNAVALLQIKGLC